MAAVPTVCQTCHMAWKPKVRSTGTVRAITVLALNLAATPGLGSWVAGHRVAGLWQMTLSLAGFVVVMAWSWALARAALHSLLEGGPPEWPPLRWAVIGSLLFGVAWLGSLLTSWRVLREIQHDEGRSASATPPVLDLPRH